MNEVYKDIKNVPQSREDMMAEIMYEQQMQQPKNNPFGLSRNGIKNHIIPPKGGSYMHDIRNNMKSGGSWEHDIRNKKKYEFDAVIKFNKANIMPTKNARFKFNNQYGNKFNTKNSRQMNMLRRFK